MHDPQIVNTLSAKLSGIEQWIAAPGFKPGNARRDLAHLQATLQLFRRNEADVNPVYVGLPA